MLGWILLIGGIIGFGFASYKDLKTTEFPDWLPYSIIFFSVLVRGLHAWILSDLWMFLSSIGFGCIFLVLGLILYFTKQWGDGDAWLLGALGFALADVTIFSFAQPQFILPFPLVILFNFFLIAFFYLIAYSFFLGIKTPKVSKRFFQSLRKKSRNIIISVIIFSLACIGLLFYFNHFFIVSIESLYFILLFPILFVALVIFIHYGRFIEKNLFKKKINVKHLTVHDVPIDAKWCLLNKKELHKIKKKGGDVWVKEGVRFAPVFLITLILTVFYGSLMFLFI